jgi:hypothetical protein
LAFFLQKTHYEYIAENTKHKRKIVHMAYFFLTTSPSISVLLEPMPQSATLTRKEVHGSSNVARKALPGSIFSASFMS